MTEHASWWYPQALQALHQKDSGEGTVVDNKGYKDAKERNFLSGMREKVPSETWIPKSHAKVLDWVLGSPVPSHCTGSTFRVASLPIHCIIFVYSDLKHKF